MGTHQNRLDAKGRVSIPAGYRAILRPEAEEGPAAVILRLSHKYPCVEAWPIERFNALANPLDRLERFSDAHDDLSATLYSDAYQVEADKEGRIMLPGEVVEHARLAGQVMFMGMGSTFEIWEPEAGQRRRAEARSGAKLRELSLPGAAA